MYPIYALLHGLHSLAEYSSFYVKTEGTFFTNSIELKLLKIAYPVFQACDPIHLQEVNSQAVSEIPNRRVDGRSNLLVK